jgi:hypothetical protein
MNGLFTVTGGLASVFLSLELGFNFTIVIALALYACALAVYRKMRDTVSRGVFVPLDSKDPMVTPRSYDAPWQPGATARSSRSQV